MNNLKTAILASLPILLDPGAARADAAPLQIELRATEDRSELSADSTIGDILRHPALSEFARIILPWDDRHYDEAIKLHDIEDLLPYHSNVDVPTVVAGLNRIINDLADGRQVLYDIYSDAEKSADPSKRNTGLFFFRGNPGAPFALVAPGGGFAYVGSVHEGFPYAVDINRHGYNAFVLKYRVGQGGVVATQDLAAAISFVFERSAELEVTTAGYSLWGSSAGARMAAAIGSHGTARYGSGELPKPATVVMAYTAHSDVAEVEPPTFVVVGSDDDIAPPSSMERRVDALRRHGTPVQYRKYPSIAHGFGAGVGTSAEGWIDDAASFWEASR